jgi:hypothetical protein
VDHRRKVKGTVYLASQTSWDQVQSVSNLQLISTRRSHVTDHLYNLMADSVCLTFGCVKFTENSSPNVN